MSTMRKKSRGYTAVEVLSAMTLFAIGAAGVIGMQKVAIQGSSDARRFDIGSNLANQWLYRLQRDSMYWTLPNDVDRLHTDIDQTRWLSLIKPSGPNTACTGTSYCLPVPATTPTVADDSYAFDVLGHDALPSSGDHFFCAQVRLNWIMSPWQTPTCAGYSASPTQEPCITGLIRADVRVFWARQEKNPIGDCAASTVDPDGSPNDYHFVYASTTLRQNSSFPDAGP